MRTAIDDHPLLTQRTAPRGWDDLADDVGYDLGDPDEPDWPHERQCFEALTPDRVATGSTST